MKTSIGRKISVAFIVILLLMGTMIYISFDGYNKMLRSLDEIEHQAMIRGAVGNYRFSITQMLQSTNDYLIYNDDSFKQQFESRKQKVLEYKAVLMELKPDKTEIDLINEITRDFDSINAYANVIFSYKSGTESPLALKQLKLLNTIFRNSINKNTTKLFDNVSKKIELLRVQASVNREAALNLIYGISAIAFLVSIAVIFLTIQRISKPIITLTRAANFIAKGDYTHKPVVRTHDEISTLASAFAMMVDSISSSRQALEYTVQLKDNIVESIHSGLLVFNGGTKVITVNRSFCELFGIDQEYITRNSVADILDSVGQCERCREAIELKKPFKDIECEYNSPIKGKLFLNVTLSKIQYTTDEYLLVFNDVTLQKQSRQLLEESEMKFRKMVEHGMDIIMTTGNDGIINYVSPSATNILGYEEDEVLGKHFTEFLHPDDLPHVMDVYQNVFENPDKIYTLEHHIRCKDGSWKIVEASGKTHLDQHGKLLLYVNSSDITEKKKAELILKKLSSSVEQTKDCIFITNKEGIIEYVNPAFEKLTGWKSGEVIGKNPKILKSGLKDDEHYKNLWATILAGKTFESVCINKNKRGDIYYVQQTISPIFDEKSDITHFVSTNKDITDKIYAELQLKESERFTKATINSLASFLCVLDENGKILIMNNAWKNYIYRFDASLLCTKEGENYFELCNKAFEKGMEQAKDLETGIKSVMNDECDFFSIEYQCDCTLCYKWYVARVSKFHGEGSTRAVITHIDITDRKMNEIQLEDSLREKSTLLKEVHHRVKNNLQVVLSLLKLQASNVKEKNTYDLLQQSQNRVKTMALIHENLYKSKDLSKIEFSAYVHKLVFYLIEMYKTQSSNIVINVEAEDIYFNMETAIPCGLLINELVSNSLKHAFPDDKKGEINLSLKETEPKKFLLIYRDNGVGLPKDIDINTAQTLGMQLIHGLTEQLDGKLEIKRSGGTEYRIRFTFLNYKERI